MKHTRNKTTLVWLLAIAWLLGGCSDFFGEKINADDIIEDVPDYTNRAIQYVPIYPNFPLGTSLVEPMHVCVGLDNLIYVADAAQQRIVCMDMAGRVLGQKQLPGVTFVTQDRTLDLLAIGTFDTLGQTLTTVYRIDQINKTTGQLDLNNSVIENKIVHPFYPTGNGTYRVDNISQVELVSGDASRVKFKSIAPFADGSYMIARNGPASVRWARIGYENNMVVMMPGDLYSANGVPISSSVSGTNVDYFFDQVPQALASTLQPNFRQNYTTQPQNMRNFLFASGAPDQVLKAKFINYVPAGGEDAEKYEFQEYFADTSRADGFLYQPNKFVNPQGVTLAGDETSYMFVVDTYPAVRETDGQMVDSSYVYQFTGEGLEGVIPPPTAASPRYVTSTIGIEGKCTSVAYYEKMLFVSNLTTGQIMRFQLTVDLD